MTVKTNTKESLRQSFISLVLCIAMLIGTTFAWFTDSSASGKNDITAGNLDVMMYYADGTEDPESVMWADASEATVFDYENWEPGCIQVNHIRVANVGTLAFEYTLSVTVDGEVSDLAKALDVYVSAGEAVRAAEREDLEDTDKFIKLGTLAEVLASDSLDVSGILMPVGTEGKTSKITLTVGVKMREDAGNEYKGLSIGEGSTVAVNATQYNYESDSFDGKYDENAEDTSGSTTSERQPADKVSRLSRG